jgi:predicted ATPase
MSAAARARQPGASLVGREKDRGAALAALSSGARLLTLLGPPGVGKTTFLRALAETERESVSCDLLMTRSADELAAHVARALGLETGPGATPVLVGEALSLRGRFWLVLDHLEGLAPDAIDVLARWLSTAPSLQILGASRTPLGVAAEQRLELEPLAARHAVALFTERARKLQPQLRVTAEKRKVIEGIVERLDGLPLAIELAAARLSVLSLEAILEALGDRFALLRAAGRVPAGQHASLWAALAWSWDLLSDPQRQMLRAASAFRGGFDLRAAEVVLADPSEPPVLDRLHALRDQSLLITRKSGAQHRFDLLESIRAFAVANAEEEVRAVFEDRHARHYVEMAEHHSAALLGTERPAALRWLSEERLNLLAAEERSRGRSPALSARAALAVYESISRQGPLSSCQSLVRTALASAEHAGDRWLVARALAASGKCAWFAGHGADTTRFFERAIAMADPPHDAVAVADWERWLASQAHEAFDLASAEAGFARVLARSAGAPYVEAEALGRLARIASERGDQATAVARADEAIRLADTTGDDFIRGIALIRRADVAQSLGDRAPIQSILRRARTVAVSAASLHLQASVEDRLGFMALDDGRLGPARNHFARAQRLYERSFPGGGMASVRGAMGVLEAIEGKLEDSRKTLETALAELKRAGHRYSEVFYGACLAAVEAASGLQAEAEARVERAVRGVPDDHELLRSAVRAVAGFVSVGTSAMARARGQNALAERALESSVDWWRAREELRQSGLAPRMAQRLLDALASRVVVGPPWVDDDTARPVPVGVAIRVARPTDAAEWTTALRVAENGSRFRLDGGAVADLASRSALREVLARLITQRTRAPGETTQRAALAAGEKKGQLQMTILRLRQLGLRDIIREHHGAYALDPATAIVLVTHWP